MTGFYAGGAVLLGLLATFVRCHSREHNLEQLLQCGTSSDGTVGFDDMPPCVILNNCCDLPL